ncbi:MAG: ribonuclease P protein component [Mycoplasmataceae bacterium]|jgi:ribonuclease P protein component|nr:ribonuclease P protein component [Mycoplasmataceae bacterium]
MSDKIVSLNSFEVKEIFLKKHYCLSTQSFLIFYKKNEEKIFRYCVSTKKKFFKLAVQRNKVKRQVRMMLRSNFVSLPKCDVVIIPQQSYMDNSYAQNQEILINNLKKIN